MTIDYDYGQMLMGELYLASNIFPEHNSTTGKKIAQIINQLPIENKDEIVSLERQLFAKTGNDIYVCPPLFVDYGCHVEIGDNFYANMDCIFLDVNRIIIGNNVMLGPRVSLYTAGHPIDPEVRASELEFGKEIIIGDNVWIGGNSVILPGISIGNNSIVAAGSVVTKNVEDNSIVGGNSAKLIRKINEQDKEIWKNKQEEYHKLRKLKAENTN